MLRFHFSSRYLFAIAALLLIFRVPLLADSLEFLPPAGHAVGTQPRGVGFADFNRDGKLDIVVANSGSANFSVLNGNGTGGFAAAVNHAVGTNPHGILVADFNRDHKDDIAVANFGDGTVTVLNGNGAGSFDVPTGSPFVVEAGPESLATADFNGDGVLDLAVTNSVSGSVSILLGTGSGSFGAATNLSTGGLDPRAITTGDFNGDGSQDLVVANAGSGSARVLFGDGLGGFPAATTVFVGSSPRGVAAGDFNHDGYLDFVTANNGSSDLDLIFGNGAGSFSSGGIFPAGSAPEAAIAADFNNDGRLDVAVADSSTNSAVFLLGTATGFAAPLVFPAGSLPLSIAAADFNSDGGLDVVLSANGTGATTTLASINGVGDSICFSAPISTLTGATAKMIATGDFNFDGNVDLAVSNYGSETTSILFGDGLGGFTKNADLSGIFAYGLAGGDMDRDGDLDLVVGEPIFGDLPIYLGSPDGSFSLLSLGPPAGSSPTSVALADMNRDGILDVVSADEDNANIQVFLGNGDGSIQNSFTTATTGLNPLAIAIGDLNRDGKLDVATANYGSNTLTVKAGTGSGGFSGITTTSAAGTNPTGVAFADFNADGRLDLVVCNYTSNDVTIKLGNGTTNLLASATFPAGTAPTFVQVADMNGDGRLDIVTANFDVNEVSVLLGNGAGAFAPPLSYSMGSSPRSLALVDVNHDGKTDIVTVDQNSGSVSVRTLTSGAVSFTISAPSTVTAGLSFNITVTAHDACGGIATGYTGTVHFTSSDSLATLPPDTFFSAADNGVKTLPVTLESTGSQSVVGTDTVDGAITGSATPMVRQFTKLQILLPGESAAPGTPTGKTGTPVDQVAGAPFGVTVNAVDPNWYPLPATDVVAITSTDTNAILPAQAALVGGTQTFNVTLKTAGNWTITASDFTNGAILANTSTSVSVIAGPFVKLQLLVPGETALPGSSTGKTGTALSQTVGSPISVTVNAVDANWNIATTVTDTVGITTTDPNALLPANAALVAGTRNFLVTMATSGTRTITSTDLSDGSKTASTSPNITVLTGSFVGLQILVPGETAAPGTPTGKTGAPTARTADVAFSVTVNSVDAYWNRVTTVTDTVRLTSTDPAAVLAADAGLVAGTRTFTNGVTLKTIGSWTVTTTDITDGAKNANTSPLIPVNVGPFTKLQILVSGETAAPGTSTGKTGTPLSQTAGVPFGVTVNAVDANWYLVSTVTDTVAISSSDANALLPPNAALAAGTRNFTITLKTGGNRTITATDTTDGSKSSNTSTAINVAANAFTKLQILIDGESAAPGTVSGKTGAPLVQRAGDSVNPIIVNAVDDFWNKVTTVTDVIHFTSTDPAALLPADIALSAGTKTVTTLNLRTAGTWTVTASDVTDGSKTANTSSGILVTLGPFAKLQILVPGETAAPGTLSGKTGTPLSSPAGVPFSVTVNAVDSNWYVINTVSDTVGITSSDANAILPGSAALSGGTGNFVVTLKTAGNRSVTATDLSDGTKTANTSPNINVVANAFTKLQILVQGETAAPGTATGKTGAPAVQRAGTAINPVVVNAVDPFWNKVTTITDVIHFTSTDPAAGLPPDQALSSGTRTYTNATLFTPGTWTLSASDLTDGSKTASTSPSILATVGPFAKLQILVEGETAAPGTATGKTGTPFSQTAGVSFNVTVNAVDSNWYLINTVSDTVGITSSDANATLPGSASLSSGTQTFSVTLKTAGTRTATATDLTDGTKTANTSSNISVVPNAFTKLQLLVPGETAAPGTTSGKTGAPVAQRAGTAINPVVVNAVDAFWNKVATVTDVIHFTSTDPAATLPADQALAAGTRTFMTATLFTVGTWTLTASDFTDGSKTASTSAPIPATVGPFAKLQILAPGETAAPGSPTGKTGAPTAQTAGVSFTAIVNAVDSNWYPITSVTDTVGISSSDPYAILPANADLVGGTQTFGVTLKRGGSRTLTATDISDGTKTANTSSGISVLANVFTKMQILVPGETADPGSVTGKTGTPTNVNASAAFSVTVNGVDDYWNVVPTVTDTVHLTSTDGTAILPADSALVAGTGVRNVTFNSTPGPFTITLSNVTDGSKSPQTSAPITVVVGAFSKLQILVPGESPAPGTPTGKTGTPIAQTAGVPFDVIVNAVNTNWFPIGTATDTVRLTSTDANAILPIDTALSGGTVTLSVTLRTSGTRTITASDITDGTKTANTSPSITVAVGAFTKMQILVPGETAAAGTTTGKTGTPTARTAGGSFTITVNAVDACWNRVTTVTNTVAITSTDGAATVPANQALAAGTRTYTNGVTLRTPGTATLTVSNITDPSKTADTSPTLSVVIGSFSKLQILVPGETAAPGTTTGKTGTPISQTAGVPFTVTVNAVDSNWYLIDTVTDTVQITSSDANAILPANAAFVAGTRNFSVTLKTGGARTVTATDVTDGTKTANTSASITVVPNAFTKLQLLVPGETAAPGTASGKTGTPTARTAGTLFSLTVNAVDDFWNKVTTVTDTVHFASTDPAATLPANQALAAGTRTFTNLTTLRTVGTSTITVDDVTDGTKAPDTSPSISVILGPFSKLQILVPGETAAPGTGTGKTGTPVAQTAGVAFDVTVNAVDSNWYLINSVTDTVAISSSDSNAGLPPNAALASGTGTFSVTLKTGGNRTVTASDITDGSKTANTSPSITVNPNVFTKLQILVPGETAAPGTVTGKTGTPTARQAGTAFSVTINAVDDFWNRVTTVTDTVAFDSSDAAATLPANQALAAGTRTYNNVTLRTTGNQTLTISDFTDGSKLPQTSPLIPVVLGAFVKLQILVPGETAAPGTASGKTGTPASQIAGIPFNVTVNAVDSNWYVIGSITDTVAITSSDANAILPGNASLIAGTRTFSVTLKTGGNRTVTSTDVTDGTKTANTSPSILIVPNTFTKLQILVPGETAAPGTASGKTGTPTARTAGTAFTVTVNAVDDFWNRVTTVTDSVGFGSSDPAATLPAVQALTLGTRTYTNGCTLRTAGSQTIAVVDASDGSKSPDTSPSITVLLGPFSKLQILVPGETAAPGTPTGKTGTPSPQTAGTLFSVTVNAVDSNFYLINTVTDTVSITASDANAVLPPDAALVGGTRTFSVTLKTGGTQTVTATDATDGTKTANTSSNITVQAAAFSMLQILVPGETAAPGSPTGKTGTPTQATAGTAFTVTVNAVDVYWNRVTTVTDIVHIASTDGSAVLPADQALVAGTKNLTGLKLRTVGSWTLTASDVTDGTKLSNTSPAINVVLGPFTRIQILVPGETAAPGTTTGKTGTPLQQTAGAPFTVTVNAVNANWYVINTITDTVSITSSDVNAVLPADASLVNGTQTFSVTLKTGGTETVTARDETDGTKTSNTSPGITIVPGAFVKLQIIAPGESAAPGTITGKTGTPTARIAGTSFNVTVKGVDTWWNRVTTATDTVHILSTDPNAVIPGNNTLVAGTRAFNITFHTAGTATITAQDVTDPGKTQYTTPVITINPGAFTKLQILVPGETASPGSATGKTGTPSDQISTVSFSIDVNAVDANWNRVPSVGDTVAITSSDAAAILPPNTALVSGTKSFNVTFQTTDLQTLTASDVTNPAKTPNTSPNIRVNVGPFQKIQILVPGETAAPGTPTGKTGTPLTIAAGTPFTITVNVVDTNWFIVSSVTDTVSVTSTDGSATLPPNTAVSAGTVNLSVTFGTAGNFTLTGSDITDGTKPSDTSPTITVIGEAAGSPGAAMKWTGSGKDTLSWGAAVNATSYNVYEGTLADLPNLLTGATDSCLRLNTAGTSTGPALTQTPAPGQLTWYLIRGANSGVEGSAGNSSGGPRVLNSSGSCP